MQAIRSRLGKGIWTGIDPDENVQELWECWG